LFSVEPVTISYYWIHWFVPVKYFTCKNYLDWDIFRYFYFFTKYIALLSLIVNKNEVFIYQSQNSFFVPFSYMYINSKCHTELNKMTIIRKLHNLKIHFSFRFLTCISIQNVIQNWTKWQWYILHIIYEDFIFVHY
jgi:hypothetical protein